MNKYEWLLEQDIPYEKFRNTNVLVTGANGMIASDFVEALIALNRSLQLNMKVYALCRNPKNAEKRFSSITGDDFELLIQDVITPIDSSLDFQYIFHMASSANPDAFNNYPADVMKSNFIGTMNLLDYAKDRNCRVLFVSSSEIYGENFEGVENFSEDYKGEIDYYRFRACYPESKRASETLCKCYEKQYQSDVVIVRPAFIYGRSIIDSNNRADVYFLRQGLNHENIVMYSDGKQIRSYCYINDCITGFLYVALKGQTGEAYNIGNMDCVVTMREYAEAIAKEADVEVIFDPQTAPDNKVMLKTTKLILNTEKLESLGWKPLYSLEDGLKDIFSKC